MAGDSPVGDGNVRVIRQATLQPLTDDQRELAEMVRTILDAVLAGEVVGVVAVAVTEENEYLPNIAGEYDADAMIGRLFRLSQLIDRAADEAEDEDEDDGE